MARKVRIKPGATADVLRAFWYMYNHVHPWAAMEMLKRVVRGEHGEELRHAFLLSREFVTLAKTPVVREMLNMQFDK